MTRESIDLNTVVLPEPIERRHSPKGRPYLPFQTRPEELVPDFLPMGGDQIVRQTSSTHGPDGYITVDAKTIGRTLMRLNNKIPAQVDTFSFYDIDPQVDPHTLLITYGVTARAAKEALSELRNAGHKTTLLILKTLYPVPENLLKRSMAGVRQVVMVEMNLGQYVHEIQRLAGPVPVRHYGQMDGELITPRQIAKAVAS